jgi:aldehyde dehydrogenase (NAD+)
MKTVANRIAYVKILNAGQTCVAADYVILVDPSTEMKETFLKHLKQAFNEQLGLLTPDKSASSQHTLKKLTVDYLRDGPGYSRIVSERHAERLQKMLLDGTDFNGNEQIKGKGSGKVVYGGIIDAKQRIFSPTVVDAPDLKSTLMTEEVIYFYGMHTLVFRIVVV